MVQDRQVGAPMLDERKWSYGSGSSSGSGLGGAGAWLSDGDAREGSHDHPGSTSKVVDTTEAVDDVVIVFQVRCSHPFQLTFLFVFIERWTD